MTQQQLSETLTDALVKKDALGRHTSRHLLTAGKSAVDEFHRSPGRVANVAHFKMLLSALRIPQSVIEKVVSEEAAQHEGAKTWYFNKLSSNSPGLS